MVSLSIVMDPDSPERAFFRIKESDRLMGGKTVSPLARGAFPRRGSPSVQNGLQDPKGQPRLSSGRLSAEGRPAKEARPKGKGRRETFIHS
jgi:hypothetical protein